jgi:hypothetical protein
MTTRVLGFVTAMLAALAFLAGPAAACESDHGGEDWACFYVEHVDTGYCQQNPFPTLDLPSELELLPELPSVTETVRSLAF